MNPSTSDMNVVCHRAVSLPCTLWFYKNTNTLTHDVTIWCSSYFDFSHAVGLLVPQAVTSVLQAIECHIGGDDNNGKKTEKTVVYNYRMEAIRQRARMT